jgi:hypothetical protein
VSASEDLRFNPKLVKQLLPAKVLDNAKMMLGAYRPKGTPAAAKAAARSRVIIVQALQIIVIPRVSIA